MNPSESPTLTPIKSSRRKLLKDGTRIAASAAIATLFVQGCKSGPNDQKPPTTGTGNSQPDQGDFLTELATKLKITVPLLKQHRSFMVFWLTLVTNPYWLDSNACHFPDATQLASDLGGDLKSVQIQSVFDAIKSNGQLRASLFNAGAAFNSDAVKVASGFSDGAYGDKTCPPGLEIMLSLYLQKASFNTANPSCANMPDRKQIMLKKVEPKNL